MINPKNILREMKRPKMILLGMVMLLYQILAGIYLAHETPKHSSPPYYLLAGYVLGSYLIGLLFANWKQPDTPKK